MSNNPHRVETLRNDMHRAETYLYSLESDLAWGKVKPMPKTILEAEKQLAIATSLYLHEIESSFR